LDIILKYFSGFTALQLEQLKALGRLYPEWNEKINVISRKDLEGLYDKHVLHSLSIAAVFEFQPGEEIMDLGTGGGFPGIPLAILFPEVKFHLVDSIAKKLKVVNAIAADIGLTNVTTQHTRAEDIKQRKFDFVVSRAVAPLKDLWRWSKPLLKKSSRSGVPRSASAPLPRLISPNLPVRQAGSELRTPGLICLKGGDLAREISESGTQPFVIEIAELFPEAFFRGKFLLYVPK
jgi:16S rRNA (guanine527-N7)-methyltransferase